MIFYFSGTGNSAWIAQRLAALTDDQAVSISALAEMPEIQAEKQIGFVFPVYAWGPAQPMADFAEALSRTRAFTFGVCTCGGEAGMTMKHFSGIYPLDSSYSLVMPNNYILGTDTEEETVIRRKLADAEKELLQISREIIKQEKVYRVLEGSLAGVKSSLAHFGFNHFARSARPFYSTDSCNGCGLCARNCPAKAIDLIQGKPVWEKQCYQCMRCINECPQQAIQYGKATAGRRRYMLKKYLPQEPFSF